MVHVERTTLYDVDVHGDKDGLFCRHYLSNKRCQALRMHRHLSHQLVENDTIPQSLFAVELC